MFSFPSCFKRWLFPPCLTSLVDLTRFSLEGSKKDLRWPCAMLAAKSYAEGAIKKHCFFFLEKVDGYYRHACTYWILDSFLLEANFLFIQKMTIMSNIIVIDFYWNICWLPLPSGWKQSFILWVFSYQWNQNKKFRCGQVNGRCRRDRFFNKKGVLVSFSKFN